MLLEGWFPPGNTLYSSLLSTECFHIHITFNTVTKGRLVDENKTESLGRKEHDSRREIPVAIRGLLVYKVPYVCQ